MKSHCLKNTKYWEETSSVHQIQLVESYEELPWRSFGLDGFPDFQQDQYKVSSLENDATKFWSHSIKLEEVSIESEVIHGYNRGGTLLGIPTGTTLNIQPTCG